MSGPYVTSMMKHNNFQAEDNQVLSVLKEHLQDDVKAMVALAENQARKDESKTVQVKHVTSALSTNFKRMKTMGGNETSLSSEYFGLDSGSYSTNNTESGSTEIIDFDNLVACSGLAETILTGGAKKGKARRVLKGGHVAMPGEYFGLESGLYGSDAGAGAGANTIDFANGLARSAIGVQVLMGGAHLPDMPKSFIRSMFSLRVAPLAVEKLQYMIQCHVRVMVKDLRGKSKGPIVLTEKKVARILGMKRHSFLCATASRV